MGMRDHRFGVEIETVGRSRETIARAIAQVVGGTVEYRSYETHSPWCVIDRRGRIWRAMVDGSLTHGIDSAELVTPILAYDDIPELQEVVRAVRHAGARVDRSTGIHIHIDGAPFDARTVRNLVKIFAKQEELIFHACGVSSERRARYCRDIDDAFLRQLETRRPRTLREVNRLWYGRYNANPVHYDNSRYRALNIHALFTKGTIEFRLFDGTLHAGEIKSYVQFVLALANMALTSRAASSKRRAFSTASAKYDFRCFLLRLGLIGDEFKTAREHLMKRLPGSAAWKNGRPRRESTPATQAAVASETTSESEPTAATANTTATVAA